MEDDFVLVTPDDLDPNFAVNDLDLQFAESHADIQPTPPVEAQPAAECEQTLPTVPPPDAADCKIEEPANHMDQADLAGRQDGQIQAFCWLLPCLVAIAAVTANTWIYYTHAATDATMNMRIQSVAGSAYPPYHSNIPTSLYRMGQNCSCGWKGHQSAVSAHRHDGPAASSRRDLYGHPPPYALLRAGLLAQVPPPLEASHDAQPGATAQAPALRQLPVASQASLATETTELLPALPALPAASNLASKALQVLLQQPLASGLKRTWQTVHEQLALPGSTSEPPLMLAPAVTDLQVFHSEASEEMCKADIPISSSGRMSRHVQQQGCLASADQPQGTSRCLQASPATHKAVAHSHNSPAIPSH